MQEYVLGKIKGRQWKRFAPENIPACVKRSVKDDFDLSDDYAIDFRKVPGGYKVLIVGCDEQDRGHSERIPGYFVNQGFDARVDRGGPVCVPVNERRNSSGRG